MRNPARIKPFLRKIEELWEVSPDLRFGQLIEIIHSNSKIPLFYIEEKDFEQLIKKFLSKKNLSKENNIKNL